MKYLRIFVFSAALLPVMVLKILFYLHENLFFDSWIYTAEIVGLVVIYILAIINSAKEKEVRSVGLNIYGKIFLVIGILAIISSFIYNSQKKIITGYDSIALYDARAKFMEKGATFKEIVNVAPYDFLHKNYYVSYPPFTTLVHYYWETRLSVIPVGVVYSIFLVLLFGVFIIDLENIVGLNMSFFIGLLVILNPNIYSLSVIEYTNLPFILFISGSILCLLNFFKNKKISSLLFGSLFMVASLWTRFSEPVWFLILLSFVFVYIWKFGKNIKWKYLLSFVIVFVSYLSWKLFVSQNFHGNSILDLNNSLFQKCVLDIVSGSIFRKVGMIFYFWGWLFVMYLISLFIIVKEDLNKKMVLFLKLSLIGNILMYIAGVYLFSLNNYWWIDVAKDSLTRSSLCLLPASITIIAIKLKEVFQEIEKSI